MATTNNTTLASAGMNGPLLESAWRSLEDAAGRHEFGGAVTLVLRHGEVVLDRHTGWAVREPESDRAPMAADTIFDLASLTKVVGTAMAAALLVEDGLLGLDDPVVDHLPRFRGEGGEEITVRHLLTHTSGLPAGRWLFGSARSPEEALEQVLGQDPVRVPGARVEYSDLGMILLSAVVEAAAEQPIDRFLAQRVFTPLGMMSTMYLPPLVLREHSVPTAEITERDFPLAGIVHDANAFRLGGIAGHAGLFSTARDLAVFAQTLLNGGRHGTVRILSPATVDTFTRRQPGADQRALGWDTPSRVSSAGDFFSERSFGHTGYTGTSLWIDPENDLFVVLLTNRTYTEATARETLRFRAAVHDAAARALVDRTVRRRPAR